MGWWETEANFPFPVLQIKETVFVLGTSQGRGQSSLDLDLVLVSHLSANAGREGAHFKMGKLRATGRHGQGPEREPALWAATTSWTLFLTAASLALFVHRRLGRG